MKHRIAAVLGAAALIAVLSAGAALSTGPPELQAQEIVLPTEHYALSDTRIQVDAPVVMKLQACAMTPEELAQGHISRASDSQRVCSSVVHLEAVASMVTGRCTGPPSPGAPMTFNALNGTMSGTELTGLRWPSEVQLE